MIRSFGWFIRKRTGVWSVVFFFFFLINGIGLWKGVYYVSSVLKSSSVLILLCSSRECPPRSLSHYITCGRNFCRCPVPAPPASPTTTTTPAAATGVTGREQSSPSPPPSPSIHPSSSLPFPSPIPRIFFFSLSFHALCASGEFPLGLLPSRHRAFPPLSFLSPYPRSLNPSPTGCISQPSRFPISPRNLIYVVIHTKKPLPPFPSLV